MNDSIHCNKLTGIYWIKKPIKKLKIKVHLKPVGGIISLPKFENYVNETNHINPKLEHDVEEHVFEWQEKKFSTWEIHLYGDSQNCVTNRQLEYHDMIKTLECTTCKVFSYIHEDYYITMPFHNKKHSKDSGQFLSTILDHMVLNKNIPFFGGSTRSDSALHLFKSEDKMSGEDEEWTAMHIVYDNSEYDEYSQLLSKQEAILISLYHNKTHNYLIVSPDTNNLEFNPYELVTQSGIRLHYHYEVDISFDDDDDDSSDNLMILLKKFHKKWQKKQRHLVNFLMPPLGVKKYYLTLEILTAVGFEMDNLYIEYHTKIPEGVLCQDTLQGKTHTSKSIRVDQLDQCNFGHIVELELEVNTALSLDPLQIKLFFEVISIDWWRRHRTEGYSYFALQLTPGCYSKQMSCSKPEEINKIEAKTRRFFVGGCHLIKDLEVLAKPQLMDANFTYETTGTVELRWNVISHRPTPGSSTASSQPGTGIASALLDGAETALRKYSKARAKLVAATKDLEVTYALDN